MDILILIILDYVVHFCCRISLLFWILSKVLSGISNIVRFSWQADRKDKIISTARLFYPCLPMRWIFMQFYIKISLSTYHITCLGVIFLINCILRHFCIIIITFIKFFYIQIKVNDWLKWYMFLISYNSKFLGIIFRWKNLDGK